MDVSGINPFNPVVVSMISTKNYQGKVVECKESVFGSFNGHQLIVATDFMGTNVIYGGHGDTVHRMSWDYGSHDKGEQVCRDILSGKLDVDTVCNIVYK